MVILYRFENMATCVDVTIVHVLMCFIQINCKICFVGFSSIMVYRVYQIFRERLLIKMFQIKSLATSFIKIA